MSTLGRRAFGVAFALLTISGLAPGALAQALPAATPPANLLIDERGVDLARGALHVDVPVLSIGPSEGGLTETFSLGSSVGRSRGRIDFKVNENNPSVPLTMSYQVTIDGITRTFDSAQTFPFCVNPPPACAYNPDFVLPDNEGTGTQLVRAGQTMTFTAADGTAASFDVNLAPSTVRPASAGLRR